MNSKSMLATIAKPSGIQTRQAPQPKPIMEDPMLERAIGTLALGASIAQRRAVQEGVLGLCTFISENGEQLHRALSVLETKLPEKRERLMDLLDISVAMGSLFDGGAYKPDVIARGKPKMNLPETLCKMECLIEQRLS